MVNLGPFAVLGGPGQLSALPVRDSLKKHGISLGANTLRHTKCGVSDAPSRRLALDRLCHL